MIIRAITFIYTLVLVAVFLIGLLVGNDLGDVGLSTPEGVMVQIHGHINEVLYEVWVPEEHVDHFLSEDGLFACEVLCHIEAHEHNGDHELEGDDHGQE